MLRHSARLTWYVLLCGSLAGCSYVEGLGSRVGELTGLIPGATIVETGESILRASEDITREEEYYIGRAVAARILTRYPLWEYRAGTAYLRRVGAAVAAFSDQPETWGGYHFAFLDTDEINAVAAPGGFIFVTRGFLKLLKSEDALAAVIAHEVAHVSRRHALAAIEQDRLNEALANAGKLAASLNCSELMEQAGIVFDAAIEEVVDVLLERGYSREQEFEADQVATGILLRSGYDPGEVDRVLGILERRDMPVEGGWFSTHPDPSDRRSELAAQPVSRRVVRGKESRRERFMRVMAKAPQQ